MSDGKRSRYTLVFKKEAVRIVELGQHADVIGTEPGSG
jgi:hypothetical protein